MAETLILIKILWIALSSVNIIGLVLESTPCSNTPGYVSYNSSATNGSCYKYFNTLARQYEAQMR